MWTVGAKVWTTNHREQTFCVLDRNQRRMSDICLLYSEVVQGRLLWSSCLKLSYRRTNSHQLFRTKPIRTSRCQTLLCDILDPTTCFHLTCLIHSSFLIFYLQRVYGVTTAPSHIFKLISHNVFWTLKCLWAQSFQHFVSPSAWCKGFSSSFSPLKAALVFSRNIFLIIYTLWTGCC